MASEEPEPSSLLDRSQSSARLRTASSVIISLPISATLRITDPSWTPLFLAAEAVIVDVGAVMSHAVIVSRQLGIPCVVSVVGATTSIPDGALVEVDGNAGVVRLLDDGE